MAEINSPRNAPISIPECLTEKALKQEEQGKYRRALYWKDSSGVEYRVRYLICGGAISRTLALISSHGKMLDKTRSIIFSKKDLNLLPFQMPLQKKVEVAFRYWEDVQQRRYSTLDQQDLVSFPSSSKVDAPRPENSQQSRSLSTPPRPSPVKSSCSPIVRWKEIVNKMKLPQPVTAEIIRFVENVLANPPISHSPDHPNEMPKVQATDKEGIVYDIQLDIRDNQYYVMVFGKRLANTIGSVIQDCFRIPLLVPERAEHLVGKTQKDLGWIEEAQDVREFELGIGRMLKEWKIPRTMVPLEKSYTETGPTFYEPCDGDCEKLSRLPLPQGKERYEGIELRDNISTFRDGVCCLMYLHAKNWVHYDVKLRNWLCYGTAPIDLPGLDRTEKGFGRGETSYWQAGARRAMVADWAEAVPLGTKALPGTPEYSPPELNQEGYSLAYTGCDKWALGCCLHELVYGKRDDPHSYPPLNRDDAIDSLILDLKNPDPDARPHLKQVLMKIDMILKNLYRGPIQRRTFTLDQLPPEELLGNEDRKARMQEHERIKKVQALLLERQIPRVAKTRKQSQETCAPMVCHPGWEKKYKGKDLWDRVSCFYDVMSCIAPLHEIGYIHGDLIAENIIDDGHAPRDPVLAEKCKFRLWQAGAKRALVDGWGTAIPIGDKIIAASPPYTPPEVRDISKAVATQAWDQYQLGCFLEEMVYGRRRGEFSPNPELDPKDEIDCLIFDLKNPDPAHRVPLKDALLRVENIGQKLYREFK